MNDPTPSPLTSATGSSIAGVHPQFVPLRVLAGATTAGQFNTVQAAIYPIACWRAEDVLFDFDMSNLRSTVAPEVPSLLKLIKDHTDDQGRKPPLSVFGHADPVGSDDYNKVLSGRRATSVYALLTRNVQLWEELYSTPHGGEDWKRNDNAVLRDMARFVQDHSASAGDGGGTVDQQVQQAAGDPSARAALFQQYMDLICANPDGTPYVADKADFLGRGTDADGKADYQGCSEFNPVLLFASAALQQYAAATDKTLRDAANQPNRRVLVLLFRPGSKLTASRWPCPTVKEGTDKCILRFWSDGNARRTNTEQERRFDKTHDTFACRFYQRLVRHSPCEMILERVRVRLFDYKSVPIANAPYLAVLGSRQVADKADGNGDLYILDTQAPTSCAIHWSRPTEAGRAAPVKPEDFEFHLNVNVLFDEPGAISSDGAAASGAPAAAPDAGQPDPDRAKKQLSNMGFSRRASLEDNIKDFQRALGLADEEVNGSLDDMHDTIRARHDDLSPPERTT